MHALYCTEGGKANFELESTYAEYIFYDSAYVIGHKVHLLQTKTEYFPMLFCGLLVAKLIIYHTALHSVVYYFASSSVNLFNIEERFRSKTANLTKFYVFCVMHTQSTF
jgi:hypothetical protein